MRKNWVTVFAIADSVALVLLQALKWWLIDRLTVFLYMPVSSVVWIVFLAASVTAAVSAVRRNPSLYRRFAPISICLVTALIVYTVPFTKLWINAYFNWYEEERNEVARMVQEGSLRQNVSNDRPLIALGSSFPNVSMGGNEVLLQDSGTGKYVLFFTFRGIMDSYSGFLYVPTNADPQGFRDMDDEHVEIVPYGKNWFYVSHH